MVKKTGRTVQVVDPSNVIDGLVETLEQHRKRVSGHGFNTASVAPSTVQHQQQQSSEEKVISGRRDAEGRIIICADVDLPFSGPQHG